MGINVLKITFIYLLLTNILICHQLFSQKNISKSDIHAKIDSLTGRIEFLNQKLNHLKETRDPSLYYVKKEYDHTQFSKKYEELYISEDLEEAKDMIESRLEKAKMRNDKNSMRFYNNFKDRVNKDIKLQKMHYQALFEKEKNFKKEFFKYVKEENLESYLKAKKMTELALKYATENSFTNTSSYLKQYMAHIDAIIFDHDSKYDLYELTRKESEFEKTFIPLLSSDSIHHLKEAEKLVNYCYDYSANTKSLVDTNYFVKQRKAIKTALAEFYQEESDNLNLAKITDQAIHAKVDTLNPAGVYKWNDKILVIGYFKPRSNSERVRRGEAIVKADRFLARYVEENDIGRIKDGEKFGYTVLLPYSNGESTVDFLYDSNKEMWQYMACYTKVVSNYFTKEISKYMPPITFAEANEENNVMHSDNELTDAN